MQKLINNRLFRIVGITLILYYGLFHDKTNPESLGNRLAPEKVKSNLEQISVKSVEIMGTLQKAEELQKEQQNKQQNIQKPNQDEEQKQQK